MTETGPAKGRSSRAAHGLLAALVGLALLLAAMVVGAVPAAAQNGVRAQTPVMINTVGVSTGIGAGQRLGKTVPQPGFVVVTGVAAETEVDATGFVGRKGVTKVFDDGSSASYGGEIRIPRGTNASGEVGGRQYSGHAFDQMQGRGIAPSVVDDAISNGINFGGDGASVFYSGANNVSVVVNSEGKVITVGYGQFKPR